jgi:hypothetical protein
LAALAAAELIEHSGYRSDNTSFKAYAATQNRWMHKQGS